MTTPKFNLREEELRFSVRLNKADAESHASDIQAIMGDKLPELVDGEGIIRLVYSVYLTYWNGVINRLEAMNRLLTAG